MALREIKIKWETFNFTVWCVIGPHRYLRAYIKKRHRRVYSAKADADLRGLYFPSRPKHGGIIWLPKIPRSPKECGFLTHEVSHAVLDLFKTCGVLLDSSNDEPFCYAIAHGVTAVLAACRDKPRSRA